MKRTLILALGLVFSLSLYSQSKDYNFRLEFGGNLSNIVTEKSLPYSAEAKFLEGKNKLGYHVGGFMNFNFSKYFYATAGINVINKGYNIYDLPLVDTLGMEIKKTDYSVSIIYLQVPLQLGINIPVKENSSVDLLAGGYFSFAVIGNESFVGEDDEKVIRSFFDVGYVVGSDRFDLGLKFGASYNFYNFYISAFYDWGMYKFISYTDSQNDKEFYNARHSTFGIGLGFKL